MATHEGFSSDSVGKAEPALQVSRLNWYRTYWPVFAMMLTVVVCWIPYFIPPSVRAVPRTLQWGKTEKNCYVTADTSPIVQSSDKYSIVLACGIVDPTIDILEDKRIILSGPFGISGAAQAMAAAFTPEFQKYMDSFGAGAPISLWQALFLIPKGTDLTRIHELSDVPSFGGKLFK